ncbi:MAG: hypothetical protein MR717_03975 [Prevotella sp.]|nr:hypothetical protein [Prevotella sp.]
MTNKENINELEAMRSQFDILKNKLNNQDIINDQLLRNAMSEKMSWIMKYVWFELLVLLPLCALSFYGMRLLIPGLPLAPMVCILLLVAISIALDFYFNRTSENDWNTENLVTTGRKLIIMKRLRWTQVAVSMPIAILLFFWYASGFEGEEAEVINIGMIVGGVIGAIVGLFILVKMNRTNDALINQIRELTKEEF